MHSACIAQMLDMDGNTGSHQLLGLVGGVCQLDTKAHNLMETLIK